jgi:hypothetical protein
MQPLLVVRSGAPPLGEVAFQNFLAATFGISFLAYEEGGGEVRRTSVCLTLKNLTPAARVALPAVQPLLIGGAITALALIALLARRLPRPKSKTSPLSRLYFVLFLEDAATLTERYVAAALKIALLSYGLVAVVAANLLRCTDVLSCASGRCAVRFRLTYAGATPCWRDPDAPPPLLALLVLSVLAVVPFPALVEALRRHVRRRFASRAAPPPPPPPPSVEELRRMEEAFLADGGLEDARDEVVGEAKMSVAARKSLFDFAKRSEAALDEDRRQRGAMESSSVLAVLEGPFAAPCAGYEGVLMARRLVMVLIYALIAEESQRFVASATALLGFILLHVSLRPFRSARTQSFETLCLGVLLLQVTARVKAATLQPFRREEDRSLFDISVAWVMASLTALPAVVAPFVFCRRASQK